jgi:hypothetical protein
MGLQVHREGTNPGQSWLPLLLILAAWLLINLVQGAITGLFDDEALFWMYGERLDWGYYEHPPMVGLLIRGGYELLSGELGVRLLFIILSTLSLFLIIRLAGVVQLPLFFAIAFSPLIMQVGGFIAAPDVPLIFFTVLFFLVYRNILQKPSLPAVLLWGIIMAAMIYSKYNGILVIFLTILSNPSLLKKRYFYIAGITGIILFIPHIIWSFRNDHPTIYYHLLERNFSQNWSIDYLFEYLPGQFGIYGPLMSFPVFWAIFAIRTKESFERALKFTACGIILFFLLYTLRGKVEPNWTLPAYVPMMVLAYRYFEKRQRLHTLIYWLAGISLVLMLAFRLYLVYDYLGLPKKVVNLRELYGWDEWAKEVELLAGERPVVFFNNYQKASKYIFYTHRLAYTLENSTAHRTQYYYWDDMERELQGKDVMILSLSEEPYIPGKKTFTAGNNSINYYGYCPDFRSYYALPVKLLTNDLKFRRKSVISLPVRIINPYPDTLNFGCEPAMPSRLVLCLYDEQNNFRIDTAMTGLDPVILAPGDFKDTCIRVIAPEIPGTYYFCISVQTGWLAPGRNMNYQKMEVCE